MWWIIGFCLAFSYIRVNAQDTSQPRYKHEYHRILVVEKILSDGDGEFLKNIPPYPVNFDTLGMQGNQVRTKEVLQQGGEIVKQVICNQTVLDGDGTSTTSTESPCAEFLRMNFGGGGKVGEAGQSNPNATGITSEKAEASTDHELSRAVTRAAEVTSRKATERTTRPSSPALAEISTPPSTRQGQLQTSRVESPILIMEGHEEESLESEEMDVTADLDLTTLPLGINRLSVKPSATMTRPPSPTLPAGSTSASMSQRQFQTSGMESSVHRVYDDESESMEMVAALTTDSDITTSPTRPETTFKSLETRELEQQFPAEQSETSRNTLEKEITAFPFLQYTEDDELTTAIRYTREVEEKHTDLHKVQHQTGIFHRQKTENSAKATTIDLQEENEPTTFRRSTSPSKPNAPKESGGQPRTTTFTDQTTSNIRFLTKEELSGQAGTEDYSFEYEETEGQPRLTHLASQTTSNTIFLTEEESSPQASTRDDYSFEYEETEGQPRLTTFAGQTTRNASFLTEEESSPQASIGDDYSFEYEETEGQPRLTTFAGRTTSSASFVTEEEFSDQAGIAYDYSFEYKSEDDPDLLRGEDVNQDEKEDSEVMAKSDGSVFSSTTEEKSILDSSDTKTFKDSKDNTVQVSSVLSTSSTAPASSISTSEVNGQVVLQTGIPGIADDDPTTLKNPSESFLPTETSSRTVGRFGLENGTTSSESYLPTVLPSLTSDRSTQQSTPIVTVSEEAFGSLSSSLDDVSSPKSLITLQSLMSSSTSVDTRSGSTVTTSESPGTSAPVVLLPRSLPDENEQRSTSAKTVLGPTLSTIDDATISNQSIANNQQTTVLKTTMAEVLGKTIDEIQKSKDSQRKMDALTTSTNTQSKSTTSPDGSSTVHMNNLGPRISEEGTYLEEDSYKNDSTTSHLSQSKDNEAISQVTSYIEVSSPSTAWTSQEQYSTEKRESLEITSQKILSVFHKTSTGDDSSTTYDAHQLIAGEVVTVSGEIDTVESSGKCTEVEKGVFGDLLNQPGCFLSGQRHNSSILKPGENAKERKLWLSKMGADLHSKTNEASQILEGETSLEGKSKCKNCHVLPKSCCDIETRIIYPLFGFSLLTQTWVEILQDRFHIVQPVGYRKCMRSSANFIRGFCKQTNLQKVMYTVDESQTSQYDLLQMPGNCECMIRLGPLRSQAEDNTAFEKQEEPIRDGRQKPDCEDRLKELERNTLKLVGERETGEAVADNATATESGVLNPSLVSQTSTRNKRYETTTANSLTETKGQFFSSTTLLTEKETESSGVPSTVKNFDITAIPPYEVTSQETASEIQLLSTTESTMLKDGVKSTDSEPANPRLPDVTTVKPALEITDLLSSPQQGNGKRYSENGNETSSVGYTNAMTQFESHKVPSTAVSLEHGTSVSPKNGLDFYSRPASETLTSDTTPRSSNHKEGSTAEISILSSRTLADQDVNPNTTPKTVSLLSSNTQATRGATISLTYERSELTTESLSSSEEKRELNTEPSLDSTESSTSNTKSVRDMLENTSLGVQKGSDPEKTSNTISLETSSTYRTSESTKENHERNKGSESTPGISSNLTEATVEKEEDFGTKASAISVGTVGTTTSVTITAVDTNEEAQKGTAQGKMLTTGSTKRSEDGTSESPVPSPTPDELQTDLNLSSTQHPYSAGSARLTTKSAAVSDESSTGSTVYVKLEETRKDSSPDSTSVPSLVIANKNGASELSTALSGRTSTTTDHVFLTASTGQPSISTAAKVHSTAPDDIPTSEPPTLSTTSPEGNTESVTYLTVAQNGSNRGEITTASSITETQDSKNERSASPSVTSTTGVHMPLMTSPTGQSDVSTAETDSQNTGELFTTSTGGEISQSSTNKPSAALSDPVEQDNSVSSVVTTATSSEKPETNVSESSENDVRRTKSTPSTTPPSDSVPGGTPNPNTSSSMPQSQESSRESQSRTNASAASPSPAGQDNPVKDNSVVNAATSLENLVTSGTESSDSDVARTGSTPSTTQPSVSVPRGETEPNSNVNTSTLQSQESSKESQSRTSESSAASSGPTGQDNPVKDTPTLNTTFKTTTAPQHYVTTLEETTEKTDGIPKMTTEDETTADDPHIGSHDIAIDGEYAEPTVGEKPAESTIDDETAGTTARPVAYNIAPDGGTEGSDLEESDEVNSDEPDEHLADPLYSK